ncbi:hypothetical protein JDV02_007628 [Purpureocillium takamizusanense]|uniref:Zn(2)-C6 fungal-type domain-containing protein n=1 Tax=Purpureocillium takamizusanense TaxID=2060973 RepID=A0A9Q8QM35_9HYPO|nr:uncharacterized protein JDV02_007628 [Purpureocillium takamizusanense]UNI21656.1 hypothetical protein JDV02_007628 [Purpureocillium takamizusanense]
MLSVSCSHHATPHPFGHRPDITRGSRGAPDLGWDSKREESERAARVRAYPTPPMSGSPPLPPRIVHEANEYGEGPSRHSGSLAQDVYRDRAAPPQHVDAQLRLPPPLAGYQREPQRVPYVVSRYPGESLQQTPSYASPESHLSRPELYQHQHVAAAGPSSEASYAMVNRGGAPDNQPFASPKSQRKAKGHVASACVPCKRAHLRCDAQRPCSRCLSNGKEDACVDVQHKKRGRPRLRDDRDTRYDALRIPSYTDISAHRPFAVYAPGGLVGQEGDEMSQHRQFHRSFESPVGGTLPIRQYGRPDDVSVYGASPEPVAFLTMGMEFAKTSPAFLKILGVASLTGRRLRDLVVDTDVDSVMLLQNRVVEEQRRREPNYLPPILGGGPALQGLGFTATEISQFVFSIQDRLTFVCPDGYARQFGLHMGLGKEGSFYFVVMLLAVPHGYHYAQVQPSSGASVYSHSGSQRPPPTARATDPAHFDPVRHRLSEGSLQTRSSLGPNLYGGPDALRTSPGSATLFSYATSGRSSIPSGASPTQTTYDPNRSQTPYSAEPARSHGYQLAPIRAQSEHRTTPVAQAWQREERPSRLDIEGLINRPQRSERNPREQ